MASWYHLEVTQVRAVRWQAGVAPDQPTGLRLEMQPGSGPDVLLLGTRQQLFHLLREIVRVMFAKAGWQAGSRGAANA